MRPGSRRPGASGKPAGSVGVVPGAAGGGSAVEDVTLPDGAACSGAGCSFIDEKRVLEQPAASNAASETATSPVVLKPITPSVRQPTGAAGSNFSTIKMAKVAKFQPDMVKIGCAAALPDKNISRFVTAADTFSRQSRCLARRHRSSGRRCGIREGRAACRSNPPERDARVRGRALPPRQGQGRRS